MIVLMIRGPGGRDVQDLVVRVDGVDDHFATVITDNPPIGRPKARRIGLKRTILHQINRRALWIKEDAHVVDKHFSICQQAEYEFVPEFNRSYVGFGNMPRRVYVPSGGGRFVTCRPCGCVAVFAGWTSEFQARSASIGGGRPLPAIVIMNFIRPVAQRVKERDPFSLVAQPPRKVPQDFDAMMILTERRRIAGHDQISARFQGGSGWEFVAYGVRQFANLPDPLSPFPDCEAQSILRPTRSRALRERQASVRASVASLVPKTMSLLTMGYLMDFDRQTICSPEPAPTPENTHRPAVSSVDDRPGGQRG